MFTAGPGFFAGGPPPVIAGALDSFTANLWAAYGITRQISSAVYSGGAIQVRRSTGGDTTTQQDIGFVGTALDTAALATFAGAESVVVTKLYDQSGNGRDLVQATTTKQPRIVNAGVYDGFLRFDGTAQEFATSATSGTPAVFSVASKSTFRAGTPTQVVYASGAGGAGHTLAQVYIPSGASQLDVYIANNGGTAGDRTFVPVSFPLSGVMGYVHALGAASAALACRWFFGGSEQTGGGGGFPTGTFTAETWRLGSGGGANYAQINVYSFAIWEANEAASMAAIATAMA